MLAKAIQLVILSGIGSIGASRQVALLLGHSALFSLFLRTAQSPEGLYGHSDYPSAPQAARAVRP
jgi:hypothetical protein